MLTGTAWLNREKLIFMATFACLLAGGTYSLLSEPSRAITGRHKVNKPVPGKIEINLETRFQGAPSGANPFAAYVSPRPNLRPRPPITPPVGPEPPIVNRPPRPPKPPQPPKPPKPNPVSPPIKPTAPKPYEVPVNFKGVVSIGDGKLYVLLKTKDSRENRYLARGDIWPETGLNIVRITHGSVMLQNDKGERFLMRDLYAKKTRPGETPDP